MAGRGGERLRLDGPRETAQVTVGRPGLNRLPVAGCTVLAKFPPL